MITSITNISLKEFPKFLPTSIKAIDWRVATCFALAIVSIILIATRYTPPQTPKIIPDIKNITPNDLDFTPAELEERGVLPGNTVQWTLKDLIVQLLTFIRLENRREITFNGSHQPQILRFLTLGLPPNISFEKGRQTTWVYRILKALQNKKVVHSFFLDQTKIQLLLK